MGIRFLTLLFSRWWWGGNDSICYILQVKSHARIWLINPGLIPSSSPPFLSYLLSSKRQKQIRIARIPNPKIAKFFSIGKIQELIQRINERDTQITGLLETRDWGNGRGGSAPGVGKMVVRGNGWEVWGKWEISPIRA